MRSMLPAVALMCCLASAQAVPTQTSFAADGYSNTWDCRYRPDRPGCSPGNAPSNGTSTHGADGASSSAQDAKGYAWSSAQADPGAYLPVLKAYAATTPGYVSAGPYGGSAMADTNVWAVQGYRYTGTTPFTLTLTVTFDTVFSAETARDGYNHSMFAISLFDTAGYRFDYNLDTASGSYCPILFGEARPGCATMPEVLARDQQFLYDTGSISTTISTTLAAGQTFYVGAYLDANVCCGGTVDTSHTLTLRFNDASQLDSYAVPVVTAVPEPGMLAMIVTGFALFGARRLANRRTYLCDTTRFR